MKKRHFARILLCLFFINSLHAQKEKVINWKKINVLVYTKNGKGYVHENIPEAVACLQNLGKTHGFGVTVTDTAIVFAKENLEKYNLVIFTNTNNDVFDTDQQRLAFRQYIEAGGGMVGIHSVLGTERNWTWFKQMLGGTFAWHPHFQKYQIKVLDPKHASVEGLPLVWEKEDECYFAKEMYPGVHPFLAHDVHTLVPSDEKEDAKIKENKGSFGDIYPAAWHHFYDGGVSWITTLGHDKKDYKDPIYVKHLFQGIRFVVQNTSKLDYRKAYATDRNSALK
jgi:uncharacterized protein